MRKTFLALMLLSLVGFFACEGDISPVIILEGGDSIDHVLNQEFIDPGFTAFDDDDGDVTSLVTATELNVNLAGNQIITYTVVDSKENTTEVLRTVNVYNEINIMAGNWIGEYVFPYPGIDKQEYMDSISPSTSINMNIVIQDFAGNIGANLIGTVVLSGIINAPAIIFYLYFIVCNQLCWRREPHRIYRS